MSMSQRRGARSALSLWLAAGLFLAILGVPGQAAAADGPSSGTASAPENGGDVAAKSGAASVEINKPAELETPARLPINLPDKMGQTMQNVVLFGLISLAPVALLDGDGIRADQHRSDLAAAGPGQSAGARQPSPDRAGALADGTGDAAGGRARLSRRDRPLSDEDARRKGRVGGGLAADQGVHGPPDRQVQA